MRMLYAVCCVPVAAMRREADHRSEMISQLLFGEYCRVIETGFKGWVNIESRDDGYTGWCQQAQLQQIETVVYHEKYSLLAAGWVNAIEWNNQAMQVPFGSSLGITAAAGTSGFKYNGLTWDIASVERDAGTIKKIAYTFLNTAYLWGGRSVFGIDCSGFTQMVYKFLGVPLVRDASQQATQGTLVDFLQEAVCGDLAFFDDEQGNIIHTGLLLSPNEIIHAAGKVRVDQIDHAGIMHSETGQRTQNLRLIKRFF